MPELHDPTREALAQTVSALVERHGGPSKVGRAVGADRSTVHRWMAGTIGIDKLGLLADKLGEPVVVRFGPDTEKEALRPEWAEGLLREVRLNRAVIQAAFAVGDPGFVQRVMDRLASLEEPPTPRGDEAHAGAGAAT